METLKRPKRILFVDVPIRLDDGTVARFEGYRVQHNTSHAGVVFLPRCIVPFYAGIIPMLAECRFIRCAPGMVGGLQR